MKYINVVGTSAAGKSTFARALAEQLGIAYIQLDDLFWLDDWQESSDSSFFAKIQQAIDAAPQGYVIDGNYTRSIAVKWQQVDSIIWLDLPFHINLYRAVRRALSRAITQRYLWPNSNNRESSGKLLSRDSIVLWMMKTHRKNRQYYQQLMQQYSQYQWIRLDSVHAMNQFLATQPYKPK